MIYKLVPIKDTFITNVKVRSVPQTGSNVGSSEVLDLFKVSGISGSAGSASTGSLSRILMQFDFSKISELTSSNKIPSSGVSFYLKMYDAKHVGTIPTSYDVKILPLSKSWDEGRGLDTDYFRDKGFANWDKAQRTTHWTSKGGDYLEDVTASCHFDLGDEDLEVNVTDIVYSWLTGGLPNSGFMVKLADAEESNYTDYSKKRFFSRTSHFCDKRPVLELRWDDSLKDDRGVFIFDYTGSLYLYNKKKGQLRDIEGIGTSNDVLTVTIYDQSGSVLVVSGSHTGRTGIYSASFLLPSSSYSGSVFHDAWSAPDGRTFMTGTFYPSSDVSSESNEQESYTVKVTNIRPEYENDEEVRLNLFVKTKTYNPSVVLTGSLSLRNTVVEKGYYRIDNLLTGQSVIPLGTGSVETTRLSYDENGNYFNFNMNSLCSGEVYKIVFFFDVDGQLQRIDEGISFKVI